MHTLSAEQRRELALRPALEVVDRTVVETNPTFKIPEEVDRTVVDSATLPNRLMRNMNRPRTRTMTRPYEEPQSTTVVEDVIDVEPEWETLDFD